MKRHWRQHQHQYYSCTRKFVHPNYWSAMLHARIVERLNPGSVVAIYPCEYCEGIHVGRCAFSRALVQGATKLDKIMAHPNFWLKAPPHIQEKMLKAREDIQMLQSLSPSFAERCQASREASQ